MARNLRGISIVAFLSVLPWTAVARGAEPQSGLRLHVSWGHRSPAGSTFFVRFTGDGVTVADAEGEGLEDGDGFQEGAWQTRCGGEDTDGVALRLQYPAMQIQPIEKLEPMWRDLIARSDPDTARRLRLDPAYRRDPRKLTVQMNRDGTRGFSLTVDQLLQNRVFWVPSLDVFLAVGDRPVSFAEHQKQLETWQGKRILDQVHRGPEATYAEYTARWEDMGSPAYVHPSQRAPGHIVGLTWDSAIPKFGIDRGAGVWNDYGNPDRFRFWFDFGDVARGITETWKGQRLENGLPVVTTAFEKDGIRYEVEQFAYPLAGPPPERRGDIAMVLLQKVTVVNLGAEPKSVVIRMTHRRQLEGTGDLTRAAKEQADGLAVEQSGSHRVLLSLQGAGAVNARFEARREEPRGDGTKGAQVWIVELRLPVNLTGKGSRQFVVKLPSPVVAPDALDTLLALDYATARAETLKFWSDYLARGARFQVPEKVVNDLFRANLWHALRLPRRHGGQEPGVKIDLPYSNFAYTQHGTPWPVNQSVYVDTMIHDLRGYHDVSLEELLTIYGNNQEANGHVGGNANWGVYTPAMIYSSAQHYLLSQDREAFERLLPPTLKALDWCLTQIGQASGNPPPAQGLVRAPLNDLTGEGVWAFNQAYLYAGMATLGRALQRYGHPRAGECLAAARRFRRCVQRGFAAATVQSPLVQLRDHTWAPYVPCEVLSSGRRLDQWYPTDVDTGAVHLLRLGALPCDGDLANYLLDDHEDNLFLNGWGMANEPVYNQQATAYLLRDDPKAAIRAFYSYMACAFSHSALEPVEHRWTWGQYFGPPSTDGAWFDLYRHMLIRELDDDTLLLLGAAPRKWLEDGKRIEIERAPTYYGKLSMRVESQVAANRIRAEIDMPSSPHPKAILVRFRHPEGKPIQSVTVNGDRWPQFDREREWVTIPNPRQRRYAILVSY